jgi:hypothetical protein
MAVPPSARFWALLGQVMRYAVDISDDYPLTIDDIDFGTITPEVFLSDLYVPWDRGTYEARLGHHLQTAKALVIVAGGRGAGKTSSLLSASETLKQRHRAIRILSLNIRRLYDRFSLQKSSGKKAYDTFAKHVEIEVRRRLFPDIEDSMELIAWVLAGPPDEDTQFDSLLLSDLHDHSIQLRAQAKVFAQDRAERVRGLKDWFLGHGQDFAAVHRELQGLFRLRHSILARTHLSRLDKLILVYDNVDKIPGEHQTTFIEVANDSQLAMGSLATSCVAMRTEHLRGAWEGQERGGSLVHLILPNERQYSGVLLPILEEKQVAEILVKRHLFSLERYKAKLPGEAHARPIRTIHKVILEQFRESHIHRLTNENLRAVAALYIGFMQFLYNLSERRQKRFESFFVGEGGEKHAHTLFYLWLRVHGPLANVQLYDVLRIVDDRSKGKSFSEVASVHHFLLTCTANLTEEIRNTAGPHEYPSFRDVAERMGELGFTFEEVKRAVKVMLPEEEEEGTLEFANSDPLVEGLQPESRNRIRLTKLGTVLVTEVFSKVGYVWAIAHSRAVKGGTQDPDLAYLEMSVWMRIRTIFDYIGALAGSHLNGIRRLEQEWRRDHGDNWLERYRRRFGINGKVQVERIMQEAAAFYEHEFRMRKVKNVFDELQVLYAGEIDELRSGTETGIDFSRRAEELGKSLARS